MFALFYAYLVYLDVILSDYNDRSVKHFSNVYFIFLLENSVTLLRWSDPSHSLMYLILHALSYRRSNCRPLSHPEGTSVNLDYFEISKFWLALYNGFLQKFYFQSLQTTNVFISKVIILYSYILYTKDMSDVTIDPMHWSMAFPTGRGPLSHVQLESCEYQSYP